MVYTPQERHIVDLEDMRRWVTDELQRLGQESAETTALELRPIFAAPVRPREGMIVYADGTQWDPGSGEGSYEYVNGVWRRLYNEFTDTNSFAMCGSGGANTVAGGVTAFLGPSGFSASESNVVVPIPVDCHATVLTVVGNDPTAGQTVPFTLRKSFADTAIVATIPNGTNVATATGNVAFSAGDRAAVKIIPSAGAALQGPISFGILFTVP